MNAHKQIYFSPGVIDKTFRNFFFTGGSIDSSQFPSQSTNSLDISIFSDIERLSQEFRQFQSTFGQNVRELTTFKASATDEIERLSENVNELLELVKNQ